MKGIYAGKTFNSDEHILMTEAGSQTYRTVHRLPEDSQCQNAVLDGARGAPCNGFLGIFKSKALAIGDHSNAEPGTEIRTEETYDFGEGGDRGEPEVVLIGAPPMAESARPSAATPVMPPTQARQGSAPMAPIAPAAVAKSASPRLNVESRGRSQSSDVTNTGQVPKKQKMVTQEGTTSAAPGNNGGSASSSAQLAQAEAELNEAAMQQIPTDDSINSDDNRVSAIEAIYDGEDLESKKLKIPPQDVKYYKAWLNKHKEIFETEMAANLMDHLDALSGDGKERLRARKEELRKLNDEFGAFTPRDGRELSKDIVVFGHKWSQNRGQHAKTSNEECGLKTRTVQSRQAISVLQRPEPLQSGRTRFIHH